MFPLYGYNYSMKSSRQTGYRKSSLFKILSLKTLVFSHISIHLISAFRSGLRHILFALGLNAMFSIYVYERKVTIYPFVLESH